MGVKIFSLFSLLLLLLLSLLLFNKYYYYYYYTVEPRLTTPRFIRPPRYYGHILSNQKYKTLTHFIIVKTPLMRPPRYYDQDFMAQ